MSITYIPDNKAPHNNDHEIPHNIKNQFNLIVHYNQF